MAKEITKSKVRQEEEEEDPEVTAIKQKLREDLLKKRIREENR